MWSTNACVCMKNSNFADRNVFGIIDWVPCLPCWLGKEDKHDKQAMESSDSKGLLFKDFISPQRQVSALSCC